MIKVEWDNAEHTIILWTFNAPWTFDEFHAAQREMNRLIDTFEGRVDSIYLTSAAQFIPLRAITHMRTIITEHHPRQRYAIIVGAKTYLNTLLTSVTELVPGFGRYLRFARTLIEAHSMIEKLRAQKDLPVN